MESSVHLQHLYNDVPFHELFEKDVSQLSEKELEAFIQTTRAQRVAPSERRKAKTTTAKTLSGKQKKPSSLNELSHLV